MTPADRVLCATTARWLSATHSVASTVGLGAALVATLLLLARAPLPAFATAALLLSLVERTLALRTRFDAGLFADLAQHAGPPEPLTHLDDALAGLQLRPCSHAPRALLDRVRGARCLTQQHLLAALLQFAAVAAPLLWAVWGWS